MAKIIKRYEAALGAPYGDGQAQIIGERLEEIGDGKFKDITPQMVLDDARKKSSPLHNFFTWDNADAAQQYRLWQARNMLSHLRVVIIRGGNETEFKAFHNIRLPETDEDEQQRVYRPALSFAKTDKDIRQQVIDQAKRELDSWRNRYADYQKLFGGLFAAINEVLSEDKAA